MITKKYYKLVRVSHADSGYFYIKNVSNETGEFKINKYSSGTMEYSIDGVTWTSYDFTNKPGVNVNPGSNIYLRGTNFKSSLQDYTTVFDFNKDYNIGGNFMSISNYSTMSSVTTIDSNNEIRMAFYNQTHLIDAEDLNLGNVTTILNYSFQMVFGNCNSLTKAPDFSSLSTLESFSMLSTFTGCGSLLSVPDFSNLTSVGQSGLQQCFYGCSSLEIGADFSNLISVGQNGLQQCFKNCYKLSNVTTPNVQDLTQNNVLNNWLDNAGTQATGTKTVNVPTGATITTGSTSGIPSGWTRVDY